MPGFSSLKVWQTRSAGGWNSPRVRCDPSGVSTAICAELPCVAWAHTEASSPTLYAFRSTRKGVLAAGGRKVGTGGGVRVARMRAGVFVGKRRPGGNRFGEVGVAIGDEATRGVAVRAIVVGVARVAGGLVAPGLPAAAGDGPGVPGTTVPRPSTAAGDGEGAAWAAGDPATTAGVPATSGDAAGLATASAGGEAGADGAPASVRACRESTSSTPPTSPPSTNSTASRVRTGRQMRRRARAGVAVAGAGGIPNGTDGARTVSASRG